MTIDDLTDEAFWNAFSKDSSIRRMFEPYEIKYKAHKSQKGQPGYDPNNTQWYAEAKKDSAIIEAVKNFVYKQKGGQKAETKTSQVEKSAGFSLPNLTITQSAIGLATIVLLLATASSFGATAPLATAYALAPLY